MKTLKIGSELKDFDVITLNGNKGETNMARRGVWRKRGKKRVCVSKRTGKRIKAVNCGKRKGKKRGKRRSLRSLGLGLGLMDFGRATRRRRRQR